MLKPFSFWEKRKGFLTLLERGKPACRFFCKTPLLMPWLRSPIIKMDEKKILFRRQFEGKVSPVIFKVHRSGDQSET
jgi:hypothetical protein